MLGFVSINARNNIAVRFAGSTEVVYTLRTEGAEMSSSPNGLRSALSIVVVLIFLVGSLVWLNIRHYGETIFCESGQLITEPGTPIPWAATVARPKDAQAGQVYTRRRLYGWPLRSFGVSDAVSAKHGSWEPFAGSVNVYFWANSEPRRAASEWQSKLALAVDIALLLALPAAVAFGLNGFVRKKLLYRKNKGASDAQGKTIFLFDQCR